MSISQCYDSRLHICRWYIIGRLLFIYELLLFFHSDYSFYSFFEYDLYFSLAIHLHAFYYHSYRLYRKLDDYMI